MQLVGCDRMHEEITRNRTGATTPRERMPKRRMKATHKDCAQSHLDHQGCGAAAKPVDEGQGIGA
jgi:hypothetical protein